MGALQNVTPQTFYKANWVKIQLSSFIFCRIPGNALEYPVVPKFAGGRIKSKVGSSEYMQVLNIPRVNLQYKNFIGISAYIQVKLP